MGKGEVEVGRAEGWLGDAFDLLQYPRAQIDVGGGARAYRLPRPRKLDMGQMHIDPPEATLRKNSPIRKMTPPHFPGTGIPRRRPPRPNLRALPGPRSRAEGPPP